MSPPVRRRKRANQGPFPSHRPLRESLPFGCTDSYSVGEAAKGEKEKGRRRHGLEDFGYFTRVAGNGQRPAPRRRKAKKRRCQKMANRGQGRSNSDIRPSLFQGCYS